MFSIYLNRCVFVMQVRVLDVDRDIIFYCLEIIIWSNSIGNIHGFSCINICQVQREMLKTEAAGWHGASKYFSYFSTKTYVVGTHQEKFGTHNIFS